MIRSPGIMIAGLTGLVCITFAGLGCQGGQLALREYHLTGSTMGTTYTVKVVTDITAPSRRPEIGNAVEATLESVNDKMSTYRPQSELSRFNVGDDTSPFKISPETLEVFQRAQEISEVSGGAFDVTVGPLVNAWGFGPDKHWSDPPAEDDLTAMRERVGYEKLEIDPAMSTVRKQVPDMYCDFGAIAKGYGVDQVAETLEKLGLNDYMVEVGGEVRTAGMNGRGIPWQIAIQKPDAAGLVGQLVVPMSGKSMATSGDYRNYYEKDGVRLSHTIDPRTAKPIAHNLASVSVIHDECVMADGYATALMVLGPEEGYDLACQLGLAAFFMVREPDGGFSYKATPAFNKWMQSVEVAG